MDQAGLTPITKIGHMAAIAAERLEAARPTMLDLTAAARMLRTIDHIAAGMTAPPISRQAHRVPLRVREALTSAIKNDAR